MSLQRVAGLFSPHVAECIALREGLEMAMACGVAIDSVETDAVNIVKAVNVIPEILMT